MTSRAYNFMNGNTSVFPLLISFLNKSTSVLLHELKISQNSSNILKCNVGVISFLCRLQCEPETQ